MLINACYNDYIRNKDVPSEEMAKQKQYGLAIAIINNTSTEESGCSKVFLNGPNSFQSAADFTVNSSALSSKLLSEITKNDITITNNGFLTSNNKTNANGSSIINL